MSATSPQPNTTWPTDTADAQANSTPNLPTFDAQAVNQKLMDTATQNAVQGSQEAIQWGFDTFGQGLVMSTSFGIQSAVMLHLANTVAPGIPVIFIDTGFHFYDTYRFADQLTEQLGLNLKIYQAQYSSAWTLARHGKLWEQGAEGSTKLDQIHKVEPMQRALNDLNATASLAGLRREQTQHRQNLPHVVTQRGRVKIHPILTWTTRDVHEYLKANGLNYHPLYDQGYASVGDWYNTLPITAEQHEREGRFGGLKQECGLHVPDTPEEDASRMSSGL